MKHFQSFSTKILSFVLALIMIVGLLPVNTMAAVLNEGEEPTPVVTENSADTQDTTPAEEQPGTQEDETSPTTLNTPSGDSTGDSTEEPSENPGGDSAEEPSENPGGDSIEEPSEDPSQDPAGEPGTETEPDTEDDTGDDAEEPAIMPFMVGAAAPTAGKNPGAYLDDQSLDTGAGTPVSVDYGDKVTLEIVWPANHANITKLQLRKKDAGGAYGTFYSFPSGSDGKVDNYSITLDASDTPYELMYSYTADVTNTATGATTSTKVLSDENKTFLKVNKVAIKVPTINWSGKVASWVSDQTVNNLNVTPASYSYTVYREGAVLTTGTGTSVDITSLIAANGSGKYGITVQAVAETGTNYRDSDVSGVSYYADTTAPGISDFSAKNVNTLTATVSDGISGIRTVAFSKSASGTGVAESDKIAADLSKVPGTALTFTRDITSASEPEGTWYFYAWDCFGNMVRSSADGIAAHKVTYYDYYENNVKTNAYDYVLADKTKAITLTPERTGWVFTGWYTNAGCTAALPNDTVSASTPNVYAGWKKIELDISVSPSSAGNVYEKSYDGQPITLTASADSKGAAVTWKWEKNGSTIGNAATHSFTDVSDSGTYTVVASANVADGDQIIPVSNSVTVTVTISPVTLTVTADAQSITYGDAAPAYTYTASGFVNGETKDTAADYEVEFESAYAPATNGNAGSYPITQKTATARNYSFSVTGATLTVSAKDITGIATVTLSEDTFTYDGSVKKPIITVSYGDKTLTEGEDYSVTYPEEATDANALRHAGEHEIVISYINNYAGSDTETYTIERTTLTNAVVTLSDYSYDGTAHTPVLTGAGSNPELPGAEFPSANKIHYEYAVASAGVAGAALADAPKNAGEYCVRAVIDAENLNYDETVTPWTFYEIVPKTVNITAGSRDFLYDGEEHSYNYWAVDETTPLVGTDKVIAVTVTGTVRDITDAGGVANVPSNAQLSFSAIASNYDIQYINGRLTVSNGTLPAPIGLRWDSNIPGYARWSAVSANNVEVKYHLYLFRVVDGTYTVINPLNAQDEPIPYQTSTGTLYNFSTAIEEDYANFGAPASYAFSVKAIVDGGSDAQNYTDSAESAKSTLVHTMVLSVDKDEGIDSATVTGGSDTEAFLITGATANLTAVAKTGYSLTGTVWAAADGDEANMVIADSDNYNTDVKATPTKPGTYTVKALSGDDAPVIVSFKAANILTGTDAGKVKLSFTATDAIGVKKWAITKSNVAPATGSADWHEVTPVTELADETLVADSGDFYLHISDGQTVVTSDEHINIAALTFVSGSASATGSVSTIYKAQNLSVKMPACGFIWTDNTFTGWSDGTVMYTAGSTYNENGNQTFTACWTVAGISYIIEYFYETGTSSDEITYGSADTVFHRSGKAGDTITFTEDAYGLSRLGFTLDKVIFENDPNKTLASGTDTLTLSESHISGPTNNNVISVYYKRESYKVTYTCSGVSDLPTYTYKYGATLTESVDKPEKNGYDFYGWYYNDETTRPETMPAYDIEASGFFSSKDLIIKFYYYVEELDGTFTRADALTMDQTEFYNDTETYYLSGSYIKTVSGMTPTYIGYEVCNNNGEPAATEATAPSTTSVKVKYNTESIPTILDAGTTVAVKVYYLRNTYQLTINVVKAPREENQIIYTYTENVRYGGTPSFTPTVGGDKPVAGFADFESTGRFTTTDSVTDLWFENYVAENPHALDGHTLARFADWSTGSRPDAMPDTDVNVVREYVIADEAQYTIRVWYANARNGEEQTYTKKATLTFAKTAGTEAVIGVNSGDVNLASIGNTLTYFSWYIKENFTYTTNQGSGTEEDPYTTMVYPDDGVHDQLEIDIYLPRIERSYTINYYYDTGSGTRVKFADKTVTAPWGETFSIQPTQYFDANSGPAVWNNTSIPDEKVVCNIVPAATAGLDGYATDFRHESYAVSLYENSSYSGVNIVAPGSSKSGQLDYNYTSTISPYGNYTVSVFYTKIHRSYVVNVQYTSTNLSFDRQTKPLTVTVGDTTYKLRLANKCDIVENTVIYGSATDYPGGAYQEGNAIYTYNEGSFINGFSPLGDSGYYVNSNDGDDYAYIMVDNNRFMYGNYTAYSYSELVGSDGDASERIADMYTYWDTYNVNHGTDAEASLRDSRLERIYNYKDTDYYRTYINYGAIDYEENLSNLFWNPQSYTVSLVYGNVQTYTLKHVLYAAGYTCNGDVHGNFTYGTVVNPYTLFATEGASYTRDGYTINWYNDPAFTKSSLISKTGGVKMTENRTVYGRYEKVPIVNMGYMLYQLPNGNYLSIDDITGGIAGLTSSVLKTENVTLHDDVNNLDVKTTATTRKYFLNGVLAAVVEEMPTMSFSEIELNFEDYIGSGSGYADYSLDITNTSNWLKDYCQYAPINLTAFVARDHFTFYRADRDEFYNTTTASYIWGKEITLPVLRGGCGNDSVNPGYDFAGWKYYKAIYSASDDIWYRGAEVEEGDVSVTEVKTGDTVTSYILEMPNFNVYVEGQWTPADFGQNINHYFPNENGGYDTARMQQLRNALCGSNEGSLSVGTHAISGGGYAVKTAMAAGNASRTDYIVTYYDCTEEDDIGELTLIGMVQRVTVTNEALVPVSTYVQSTEHFHFSHCVRRLIGFSYILSSASSDIRIYYPMGIDLYYAAEQYGINTSISASVIASDNGSIGSTTLSGAGSYNYKERCTLNLELDDGYVLNGWFRPNDVLLASGEFNTALSEETLNGLRLCNATTYSFITTGEFSVVAVITPESPDIPTVTLKGTDTYTYGYETADPISAITAMPASASGNTVITGYTWYELGTDEKTGLPVWTEMTDYADEEDIPFAIGKNVGTYTYKCVVSVENTLNGRTDVSEDTNESMFTVTVVPRDTAARIQGVVEYFDGTDEHGYSLVNPYSLSWEGTDTQIELYWSETELTAAEGGTRLTQAGLDALGYRDSGTYTVWYYVKANDANYCAADEVLTAVVRILPKTISISATGKLTKVYDGTTNLTAENKADIAAAYTSGELFDIIGIVEGDTDGYTVGYTTAIYDYEHVETATKVVLTNIVLISDTPDKESNYTFGDGVSLTIEGVVTPRPLTVIWTGASEGVVSEDYNAKEHTPEATYAETDAVAGETPELIVEVNGEGIDAGSYNTTAAIDSTAAKQTAGNYSASDYTLLNNSCTLKVLPVPVTVSPLATEDEPASVVYDGNAHTYHTFTASPELPTGFTIVAEPDQSYTNAGSYEVKTSTNNFMIKDADGKEATDNFTVTYGKTAITVTPRPVAVSGVTAQDKVYDANTSATLNGEDGTITATFGGIVEGDTLTISGITGTFDTAHVGTDKTVTLDYSGATLGGASASNYSIAPAGVGEGYSQVTTTASITAAPISVTFTVATVVYGQSITVVPTYKDAAGNVIPASEISGTVKFTLNGKEITYEIQTTAGVSETSYTFTAEQAGNPGASTTAYTIAADVTGLKRLVGDVENDFSFSASDGSVTVNKRPVSIAMKADYAGVTKIYDESAQTTDANKADLLANSYVIGAVTDVAESGIYNGDSVTLASFTAYYNSANVLNASSVAVTSCTLDSAAAKNYVLNNNSYSVPGSITPRPVLVTPNKDQSKVYGNADPENFTWSARDMAGKAVAQSKLTVVCNTRAIGEDVGTYEIYISADADANPNYDITAVNGTDADGNSFEIQDRPLYITPTGTGSITYGTKYGSADFGAYTLSVSGWANTDDETNFLPSLEAALTAYGYGTTAIATDDILKAGSYSITAFVDESVLDALKKDYRLIYNPKSLNVAKKDVWVTDGITADDKTYNGTTAAAVNVGGATLTGLIPEDADTVTLSINDGKVTGVFDNKNVGTGKTVSLTYASDALHIDGTSEVNYQLKTTASQQTTTASVTPKDLHITADSKFVVFGTAKTSLPAFTVSYTASDFVSGENAANALTGTVVYQDTGYTPETDVTVSGSELTIAVDETNSTLAAKNGNYTLIYAPGKLTVNKATFTSPAAGWVDATPGTLQWNATAPISNVAVDSYSVSFYKDNTLKDTVTVPAGAVPSATYTYDFAELIHTYGPGAYTAKVQTISSNTDNVNSAAVGAESGKLYAANVTVFYKNDTATNAGKGDAQITLKRLSDNATASDTILLITGEKATVTADITNDTGYAVTATEFTSGAKLTVTAPAIADAAFNTATTLGFDVTLLKSKVTSADEVKVQLAMTKTAATLDGSMQAYYDGSAVNELGFGYDAEDVEIITTPSVVNDNVTTAEYDYTAVWTMWDNYPDEVTDITGVTTLNWDHTSATPFLSGIEVPLASRPLYPIWCEVTATRKDNGEKTTKKLELILPVSPATIDPRIASSSWTYGETRIYNEVSQNPENAPVEYFYSAQSYTTDSWPIAPAAAEAFINERKASSGWVAGHPTDAGTWYIYAYTHAGNNYTAGWAYQDTKDAPTTITIHKAKLALPDNLQLYHESDSNYYYGNADWNEVKTFAASYTDGDVTITNSNSGDSGNLKENKGVSPASSITATYDIVLKKQGEDEPLHTWSSVPSTDYLLDITPYLKSQGVYVFEITAKSGNTANCLDSDMVSATLEITKTILEKTGDNEPTASAVNRVYDGISTVLSIKNAGSDYTYKWYKDSDSTAVGTDATLTLTDVVDSGIYTCVVEDPSLGFAFSTSIEITITKRAMELTADTDSKTFDGTPLTDKGFTVTTGTDAGLDDTTLDYSDKDTDGKVTSDLHVLTLSMTSASTVTNAGTVDNIIDTSSVKVMRGSIDATANYTVSTEKGTLTVEPKTLEDEAEITIADCEDVIYNGQLHQPKPEVHYIVKNGTTVISDLLLVEGTDFTYSYTDNKNVGTATVTATGKGNYDDTVSTTFDITKRAVTITAENHSKKYGAADPSFTKAVMTNNVSGELGSINLNLVRTNKNAANYAGEQVDTYTNVLTINDTKATLEAAYTNYTFTIVPANFTVTGTDAALTVTSATKSWKYDGDNHTENVYTVTLNGKNITADADSNGLVFTLYNGDKLTVTPTAAGVTNYDSTYSKNNTFTYTVDHSDWYTAQTATFGTLSITKRSVTMTSATDTKTYDSTELTRNAQTDVTVTGDGFVTGEGATYTISGTQTNYGSSNNTFTYAMNEGTLAGNYDVKPLVYGTLSVTKRAVTITAADNSKKYGAADPAFADAVMTGQVDGELSSIDLSVIRTDLTAANYAGEAVKTHADVLTINDTKATLEATYANYTFTIVPADFTISATDAAVTVTSATNHWTYDGANHKDNTYTVTLGGNTVTADTGSNGLVFTLYNGDKLTVTPTAAGVTNYNGSYSENNTFTYTLTHSSWYTAQSTTKGTLSIDKRAVTITAADNSKKYGAADPAFADATMSGHVTGELTAIDLSVIRTDLTAADYAGEAVGTHTDVLTINDTKATLDATYTNYTFTIVPADFTINTTDAAVSVTSATNHWTYDGTNHTDNTYTVKLNGTNVTADAGSNGLVFTLYNGDKLTVTPTAGVTDYDSNYSENNTFTYTLTHSDWYTVQSTTKGTLSIDKRAVTITALNSYKKYGTDDPAFTDATMTGHVTGELTAIDLGIIRTNKDDPGFAGEQLGTYTGVLTIRDSKATLDTTYPNYVFTIVPANFTINASTANVTVISATQSWTYDGANHTKNVYTVDLDGNTVTADADSDGLVFTLYNGNKLTVTPTAAGVTDYDSTYSENNTFTYVLENSDGYAAPTITFGTLSIIPKSLADTDGTISIAKPEDVVYNSTAFTPKPEVSYTPEEGNVRILVDETDFDYTYSDNLNAGTATVMANGKGNYSGTVSTTFEIAKRPVTLTSANNTKTYDGTPLTKNAQTDIAISGDGFAGEEGATYSITGTRTVAGVSDNAFTYTMKAGALESNYDITTVFGKLTVEKRSITFTGETDTREYTGTDINLTGLAVDGLVAGETHNVTYLATGIEAGGENGTVYTGVLTSADDVLIEDVNGQDVTDSYSITLIPGSLTIVQTTAFEISLEDYTVTFDGEEHYNENMPLSTAATAVTTYSYSFSESGEYVGSLTKLTKVEAGTYPIYVKATNPNYSATATTQANLIIKKTSEPLTVTLEDDTYTYDALAHHNANKAKDNALAGVTTFTYAFSNGEETDNLKTLEQTDAGHYVIVVTVSNPNYVAQGTTTAELIINPAEVKIGWSNPTEFRYDGQEHGVKATVKGIIEGSGVTYRTQSNKDISIGDYTAKVIFIGEDKAKANYTLPKNTKCDWSITPNPAVFDIKTNGDDIQNCVVNDEVQEVLTAHLSEDTNVENPTYQWYRKYPDGSWQLITGASTQGGYESKYTLTAEDAGATIKCVVVDSLIEGGSLTSLIATVPLMFTKGMGQTHGANEYATFSESAILITTVGMDGPFQTNGAYPLFESISIDGKQVDKAQYTAFAGCTEIVLAAELIDALENGEHVLTAFYQGGASCDTNFFIVRGEPAEDPSASATDTETDGHGNHKDGLLPLILITLALATELRYLKKRKKLEEEIAELSASRE